MAKIVDKQNIHDKRYESMSPNYDKSIAFKTACELIFQGKNQPSGYTEPLSRLVNEIPDDFEVGSPYPNPFNSLVNIPLKTKVGSEITIDVYDILGNLVKE